MATVGVTFRMDVQQYVRMTARVSEENAGLRATEATISHYIRQAIADALRAGDVEAAAAEARQRREA